MQKCPICGKTTQLKDAMIRHIEEQHGDDIPENMSTARYLYFSRTGFMNGRCSICGEETGFNEDTGRPSNECKKKSCKAARRKLAVANHVNKHGVETFLKDPEYNRDVMLANKAKVFKFDDGTEIKYLSELEKNELINFQRYFGWGGDDIEECQFIFKYSYIDPETKKSVESNYIPDWYIPKFNLIIETKHGGDKTNTNPAYLKETRFKDFAKAKAMKNNGKFNYIVIENNNYGPLIKLLYEIKMDNMLKVNSNEPKIVASYLSESATVDIYSSDKGEYPFYLLLFHDKNLGDVREIGISDIADLSRIYIPISKDDINALVPTSLDNKHISHYDVSILKYVGDKSSELLNHFNGRSFDLEDDVHPTTFLLDTMSLIGANVDLHEYGSLIANNPDGKMDFLLFKPLSTIEDIHASRMVSMNTVNDITKELMDKLEALNI